MIQLVVDKIVYILHFSCHHSVFFNKVVHKCLQYSDKKIKNKWEGRLIDIEWDNINWNEKGLSITDDFYIADEQSEDIQDIIHNRQNWWGGRIFNRTRLRIADAKEPNFHYSCTDNSISIHTSNQIDKWIYLSTKHRLPKKYSIEFDFFAKTELSEHLQIDIFSQSLSKRLQIIFSYNKELVINAVDHSLFIHRLYSAPFSLPIDCNSHIRMEISGSKFSLSVDGDRVLSKEIKNYKATPSYLFILFWNEREMVEINNTISNFKYYE